MRKVIISAAPLFPIVISLMAGILLGERLQVGTSLWPLFAIGVVAVVVTHRWAVVQSVAILTSALLLGLLLVGYERESLLRYSYDGQQRQHALVIVSEGTEKERTVAFDVLLAENGRKLKCYLQKDERSLALKPGDGVMATIHIEENYDFRSGRFDYRDYLEKHGFAGRCYVRGYQWQRQQVSLKNLSLLTRSRITFLRWRHTLLARYQLQGATDDRYAVLAAMTLGDKSALTRELRDVYSMTGASHVLALSGLHLGILYLLLSRLTLGRRRSLWAQLVLLAGIWAFVFLVGLPTSVVRSAVMLTVFSVFTMGGRTYAPVNVLCFAALLILIGNPYALFDVGFQLSFASMLAIFLIMPLTECWVSSLWIQRHSVRGAIWSALAVSLAAQLGVAPLVAYYFGRFSCYFLLTNLLVLPAAYLILLGALVMLLIPVPAVSAAVLWMVGTLNSTLGMLAQLPGASIENLQPSQLQVILVYIILMLVYLALLRLNNVRLTNG